MENKYKGWIENFASLVEDQLGVETKHKILDQCKSCVQISDDHEMSKCVNEIMINFDQFVLNKEKRYNVMESLGNTCFNSFFAKIAENLKKQSKDLADLIKNLNKASGAEYFKLRDNKIYATFHQCLCQIGVRETEEPISKTYCSCSLGWMKSLFNIVLDKPFKVELIESIVSGGKVCHFVINFSNF